LDYTIPPFIVVERSEEIDSKIVNLPRNKYYAVRSSANLEDSAEFSFAGIFDTYLNISHEFLKEYSLKVFDLSKNNRLKSYLGYFDLDISTLQMQVIVQEMVNCEKAGVAFSRNPVNSEKEIYIEAVWGLGEQCVSGKSASDIIRIDKTNSIIYEVSFQGKKSVCNNSELGTIMKNVDLINQSKRKLSNRDITSIKETISSLSNHFNFEFEIEWGFVNNLLYIFQIRPITTLK
jgi:pyruvate,water dikinase